MYDSNIAKSRFPSLEASCGSLPIPRLHYTPKLQYRVCLAVIRSLAATVTTHTHTQKVRTLLIGSAVAPTSHHITLFTACVSANAQYSTTVGVRDFNL